MPIKNFLTPNQFKKEANLPSDALFLGYAVTLEESNEFLTSMDDNLLIWSKDPGISHTFPTLDMAKRFIDSRKPEALPCYFFETDDQDIVATIYD